MDTKKLRKKILDLAIHGKLVPQDPNDEPASVLLEHIRSEKERLIKEGKIKRSRKTTKTSDAACDKQEVPFEVPSGWVWTCLYDITSIIGDGLHGTPQYDSQGFYYFINGNNLYKRKIIFKEDTKRLSKSEYEKYKKTLNDRTILVSINGTIGNIGTYNGENVVLGKSACYFNLCSYILKDFICYLLESNYFLKYALGSATGSTIKNVPLKAMNNFCIPLPPYVEQQRIVEEVERWFKLIDIIEQGKTDLQSTIKQAKNKILDLAIHGKLVPQDPNNEPASELLKRINPKAEITCDNGHYPKLPKGWTITSMQEVCRLIDGEKLKNRALTNLDARFLRGLSDGKIIKEGRYVSANTCMILVDGENSGEVFITPTEGYQGSTFKQLSFDVNMNKEYILYIITQNRKALRENKVGSAIPHLNKKLFKAIQVPIPPYAEQERIVCAINTAFNKLNTIEESL